MSGGGGGSSSTTQTTKMEPPPQLAPYFAPFMQQASSVAMTPYQSYGGQQIAGFTPDQLAGFDMARNTANQAQGALAGASGQLNSTIGGQYMGYSPGTNAYLGATSNAGQNAYLGATTSVGQNTHLGQNNPYLNSAIDSAHGDISRTFENSVFNNTDAMMARSGAFGGSAWQQAQAENARQMSNELGRTSNDMRMADYGLQAQLSESDVNRRLQAQQNDLARNAGLSGQDLDRSLQAQQTDFARNAALSQAGLDMANSNFQNERLRQLQAAGMVPGMAQAGYANSQALLGIGDAQQAQNQGALDLAYQDWMQQQNHPYQSLDVMGNAIRTLMGGGGTQTQTGPNPYQRSGTASALGGAIGGGTLGMQFGGPMGGAIGAGLGLLGGLL
ncbi:MAG: hypothetical protein WBF88_17490 [Pusillimonas sp.]